MGLEKRRKKSENGFLTDSEGHRDRISIEKILVDNEGGYLELIENSDNLIQSVTPEGLIYFVNHKWLETLKYGVSEVKRLSFLDVIHPLYHSHCLEVFSRIMARPGIEEVEFEFQAKDGMRVPVKGNVSCYFVADEPVATRGFFRQISERQAREFLSGTPLEKIFLAFYDKGCSIAEPCLPD